MLVKQPCLVKVNGARPVAHLPVLRAGCPKAVKLTLCKPLVCKAVEKPSADIGGGDGGNSGSGKKGLGGGKGDGSSNGENKNINPAILELLAAAGRTIDSFPEDFKNGLLNNKVTPEILKRYFELEKSLFGRMVWGIQGFRERLLADPSFPVKLAIELGIGVCMKIMAEYTKRQKNFVKEADFVFANTMMAIVADFMLTWIPAPTLSYKAAAPSANPLAKIFSGCPDNAFQMVPPGMEPFTLAQRFGAVIRNGLKLLCVGFCASMFGVGVTNSLLAVRKIMDPTFCSPNKPQNVVGTSAAYGVYMSISSNLRYQIIAGIIEERGIEVLFKGNHQLCHLLSLAARTGNTFLGSLLWVDFARLTGMQKASSH
nr:RETICULATa-RELATEd chloroplastic-like isoform a (C2E21) [Polytomella parva]|mmetsp:Transcript_33114/g.59874  ORF Transcript_33114/g.59874 Transcript_33114/m.59874 type:complete len:370 (-) Transcript_33114:460-1569(-)|eukprot:CAMPEP_0175050488 /NCGR_PEP_ID=MMETSP0052_2-20121109/7286_1 /TAXON_ID=51329 ORGANISM="Polytomella parva, Strain SAG 63-3" /NCGR_SAMPLE_ID=MMETSP0052_2 /ASSEMBLY_ACC=CAM_ASM_000194 /LENGTH=369 /DNA_ID=CAMNT_0016314695 /DNA_START=18 /DNA_END=1127 /DNA_ORIENTATION=+